MDSLAKEIQKLKEIAKHANNMLDEYLCERINKMMESEVFITMARDTRLLIISDYFCKTASTLKTYIEYHSNASVLGSVANIEDVMAIAEKDVIDIFVIIDILHNQSSYVKINELKEANPLQMSIMLAYIDDVVEDHCIEFKISKQVDIRTPVDEFLMHIKVISIKQRLESNI